MDPWSIPEFRLGLAAGSAMAIGLGVLLAFRRRSHREAGPAPLLGLAFVAVGILVLADIEPLPARVVLGVAGVCVAIACSQRWAPGRPIVAFVAALPFAGLIASGPELPDLGWFRALTVVAIALGAVAAGAVDATSRHHPVVPVLLAVTAGGIYAAVPDTEQAAAMFAVAIPLALLAWPAGLARAGEAGAGGAISLLLWSAAYGSRGRPAAMIGAAACLGLLAGLAYGPRLTPRTWRIPPPTSRTARTATVVAIHAAIVVFAARTSGLQTAADEAGALAILAVVAACGAGGCLAGWAADGDAGPDRPKAS